MNKVLSDYLRKEYPDARADLFAVFMDLDQYLKKHGLCGHQPTFLDVFIDLERLRKKVLHNKWVDTMLHLGPRAFEEIGEVVQSTTFVLRNDPGKGERDIYPFDEAAHPMKSGKWH